jgi:hypothetical protein
MASGGTLLTAQDIANTIASNCSLVYGASNYGPRFRTNNVSAEVSQLNLFTLIAGT